MRRPSQQSINVLEHIPSKQFKLEDYRKAMKVESSLGISKDTLKARVNNLVAHGYIRQVRPGVYEECRTGSSSRG